MNELGTIGEEAVACREAFKGVEVGSPVWLCHHETFIELLEEPVENRINYILMSKPPGEQARRLREFRPVLGSLPDELNKARAELDKARAECDKADAEWDKAYAEWDRAYAELDKARAEWDKARVEWVKAYAEYMPELTFLHFSECPDTAWNGRSIF